MIDCQIDVREKEDRFEEIVRRMNIEDTAEALLELGQEGLAIKIYNDALWGDDMYDEFGDYRFDEAVLRREQLRQQLGQEMFDYVEDFRGLKNENLPEEYQQLVQAKIVMRPYWQIRDDIIGMFGESYAETSWGQNMITRLRKNLRLSNPNIERAYQQFYVRT